MQLIERYNLKNNEEHLHRTIAYIAARCVNNFNDTTYSLEERADDLFLIGLMHEDGIYFQKDEARAAEFYLKARALNGHPTSTNLLGLMCQAGKGGFPKDYQKALEFYHAAAELGSLAGISNIGGKLAR